MAGFVRKRFFTTSTPERPNQGVSPQDHLSVGVAQELLGTLEIAIKPQGFCQFFCLIFGMKHETCLDFCFGMELG